MDDPQSDALLQQPGDGALMASYSVFVVEPGEDIGEFVNTGIYLQHSTNIVSFGSSFKIENFPIFRCAGVMF